MWREGEKIALLLLIICGLSLFVFQNKKNGFEAGHHGFLSSHGMALARNLLQGGAGLLMFDRKTLEKGEVKYQAYNRFPVFPFLIVGLMIRPFEPDMARQIYVARQAMNLFFFLTLIIAFKIFLILIKDNYLALCLTLVTFSSYYFLFYNDMIFNDIPALFGFGLALYGVVLSLQKRLSRSQKIIFSLIPPSFGWQPLCVYVIWSGLDLISCFLKRPGDSLGKRIRAFFKSDSFIVTSLAIIFAVLILLWQFFNEWRVIGGSFSDLPSLKSFFWRIGQAEAAAYAPYSAQLKWGYFLADQAARIVKLAIPFCGLLGLRLGGFRSLSALALIIFLLILFSFPYFKEKRISLKIPAIFILSGLLWAILMKHFVAFHDFQALYYVGLMLVFFLSLSFNIQVKDKKIWALLVSLLFVMNVYWMNKEKATLAPEVNKITAEFQAISNHLPRSSRVYVDDNVNNLGLAYHALDFYLAGHYFTSIKEADYVISLNPDFGGQKLTSNEKINLFQISN